MIVCVRRAGDDGLLVELPEDISAPGLLLAAEFASALPAVESCTTGQASLLLSFAGAVNDEAIARAFLSYSPAPDVDRRDAVVHRFPLSVHPIDAPDLPELLARTGMTKQECLSRLSHLRLTARFLGFRAGFAYLDGIPEEWAMSRRPAPRARVPAGSFAIAGTSAGFYPIESPGGWNLIGRTSELLWDPSASPPNRIAAGDTIVLEPTEDRLTPPATEPLVSADAGETFAEIEASGAFSALVAKRDQDNLRHGVPPGGPFHQFAAESANLAAGNRACATVLECAQTGPTLRFTGAALMAWSGADASMQLNGETLLSTVQFGVSAGDRLEIGRLRGGFRGYLAVSGGFAGVAVGQPVATSLRRGALLRRGEEPSAPPRIRKVDGVDPFEIAAVAGPHSVSDSMIEFLTSRRWTVSVESNRVAVRFRCAENLPFAIPGSLPSCGMKFGTVQWHPSGEIVAMGPDHPITGGYLQAMTIISSDRRKLAQLAPGDSVRWTIVR